MAENKTRPTAVSPESFVGKVADERKRRDCGELIALMTEITGEPPATWGTNIVGFGKYHYTYESGRQGDSLLTGFSPRSQNLTLYLGPGLHDEKLIAKLGKHKTGKGCLYIKTLDDIDREVLRKLVKKSVDEMRKRYVLE